MNTTMKTLMAALLASTFSTAAFAQSVSVGSDAGASAGGNAGANLGADVSTGASDNAAGAVSGNAAATAQGNAGSDQNYGQLISGLQTGQTSADAISDYDGTSEASIVLMSDLKGNAAENASALDNAISKQEETISEMRSEIEANADLKAMLEAEGYAVDQVVAVNSDTSGKVTLVVDDNI